MLKAKHTLLPVTSQFYLYLASCLFSCLFSSVTMVLVFTKGYVVIQLFHPLMIKAPSMFPTRTHVHICKSYGHLAKALYVSSGN